jgi:hypothetical protein
MDTFRHTPRPVGTSDAGARHKLRELKEGFRAFGGDFIEQLLPSQLFWKESQIVGLYWQGRIGKYKIIETLQLVVVMATGVRPSRACVRALG